MPAADNPHSRQWQHHLYPQPGGVVLQLDAAAVVGHDGAHQT